MSTRVDGLGLVGTFYCDEVYHTYVTNLHDFEIVYAIFDPDNKHDNNAIRVTCNPDVKPEYRKHIGWIAKHQTFMLRDYLEHNVATAITFFNICNGQYAVPLRVKRLKPGFSAGCIELWTDKATLNTRSLFADDVI